uniref:Uncharacterized protein n=1 Tax=viral metagenome TaxID=1070528 RepID=A0A6C0LIE6_9ZZZZ
MTDKNSELIKRISDYITSQTEKINKNELKKAVGEIFDDVTKLKKKNPDAKKRPPSEYNNYIKEHMAILKADPTNKMNAIEKMKHITLLWKEHKKQKEEVKEEEIKEVKEEEEEEEIQEVKEEEILKSKTPRKGLGAVKK